MRRYRAQNCAQFMKLPAALLPLITTSMPWPAYAAEDKAAVEVTVMAMGDPGGGKLRAGATGCAELHFMNRTKEPIYFPTAPRSLGYGRVKDWNDASYLSPKQGEGYGWGYRAAHDIPSVRIEFHSPDGKLIHSDASIQLQRAGVIEPDVWSTTPILFTTPAEPGIYKVLVSFDNTMMAQTSGHNFADEYPAKLVTLKERLEVDAVAVIPAGSASEVPAAGAADKLSSEIGFTELGVDLYGKFRFESEGELFDLIDGTERILVPAGAVLTCIRRTYSIGYFAGGATLKHDGKTTKYPKVFFTLKPSGEITFHEPSADGNFPGTAISGELDFEALLKAPVPDAVPVKPDHE